MTRGIVANLRTGTLMSAHKLPFSSSVPQPK